jgi:hypothetical protein
MDKHASLTVIFINYFHFFLYLTWFPFPWPVKECISEAEYTFANFVSISLAFPEVHF